MSRDIVFVASCGRAGTTATMLMLYAGGAKCAGTPSAFEDIPLKPKVPVDLDWVRAQAGKAVKWIEPSYSRITLDADLQCRTIFLNRDAKQQAKSQIKMLQYANPGMDLGFSYKGAVKYMTKDIKRTRQQSALIARKLGPVLFIWFEDLLKKPLETAIKMQDFTGTEFFPDPALGSEIILDRITRCMPDMAIEERMLQTFGMPI